MKLGGEKGGRILKFLRLDYFGHKNFEPAKRIEPELINEHRYFHIGYFTGNPSREKKVYISLQDLERLTKLVTGEAENIQRMRQRMVGEQEGLTH